MRKRVIVGAAVVSMLAATAAQVRAQAAPDKRVYTMCTLLIGKRDARPATGTAANVQKHEGSTTSWQVFVKASNPLTPSESVQVGEDLAELQEKLRATFQLEQIDAAASFSDWMPVGREMLLQAPKADARLLLTASEIRPGVDPPFVATTPASGAQASGFEQGYAQGRNTASHSAQYTVKLTVGGRDVFDRPMNLLIGQRNVFARQPEPGGAVYFVVVTAPVMESRHGRAVSGVIAEPLPIRGPQLVSGPDPLLPADVQARITGTLILTATIGADGTVRDVKVSQPAEGVTEHAVSALRARKYSPALDENGRPTAVQIVVAIKPQGEP